MKLFAIAYRDTNGKLQTFTGSEPNAEVSLASVDWSFCGWSISDLITAVTPPQFYLNIDTSQIVALDMGQIINKIELLEEDPW